MTNRARTLLAILLAASGLAIAACGTEEELHVEEGQALELGELEYRVQITRFLNRADPEDSAYLRGQPDPPPGMNYLATFLQIENHGDAPETLPEELTVADTRDNVYRPLETDSIFALPLGSELEGGDEIPPLDSAAANSVIQGAMLLFLVDRFVTENRPLELHVPHEGGEDGTVELDI